MTASQFFLPITETLACRAPRTPLPLKTCRSLALQDIVQLHVELVAILRRDVDERMARTKAAKARLGGALTVRYAIRLRIPIVALERVQFFVDDS